MISFSNFQTLDPAVHDLALELLDRADEFQGNVFVSLMFRWMAFNGWMSAITLESQDRKMIDAVAANPRLQDAHNLLSTDAEYRDAIDGFVNLWPVIKISDARNKLGFDVFWTHTRDQLLLTNVVRKPDGYQPNGYPTWDDVIRVIYQIRCNMFHRGKSPQNARDRDLVTRANNVISQFIAKTQCFNWHDN